MILIQRSLLTSLSERATESSPNEICGLAAGYFKQDQKIIDELIFLDNIDPDPEIAYSVDAAQFVESLHSIEHSGKEIIAIFHSHPRGPEHPSRVDTERVTWIDHSHLIIIPGTDPYLTSWLWNDDKKQFIREAVEII